MREFTGRLLRRHSKKSVLIALAVVIAVCALGGAAYAALGGGILQSSSSSVDLQKGLVGHWKLDGNGKDSTPHANDAALTNAPTLTTDRKGKANSAYSFNGSSNYMTIQDNDILSPSSITVTAWVYWQGGTDNDIVSKNGNFEYRYRINNTGTITAFDRGATNAITTSASIPLNQWTMVSFSGDAIGLKIYINGVVSASNSTAYGSPNTFGVMWFGTYASTSEFMYGKIDDIRIYDRVLNSAEFEALYASYDTQLNAASGLGGLVGHWKFDGNAKDATPRADNGTVNGATLTTDRKGKANSAYSFDGNTNYIEVPDQSQLNNTTGTWTAWFKTTAYPTNTPAIIMGKHDPSANFSNNGISISQGTNGEIFVQIKDNTQSTDISSTAPVSLNAWHHVALTFNGNSTASLYVDGVLKSSQTAPSGWTFGSGNPLRIGRSTDSYWQVMNGSIDDVRVYNKVLSVSDIANQFNSYDSQVNLNAAPTNTVSGGNLNQGLVGYLPLNGNNKDSTPYGNNATYTGTPTYATDRKGRANSALNMTGNTNYLTYPTAALPTSNISVSIWSKQATLEYFYHFANNFWTGGDGSWILMSGADGAAYFGMYYNGAQYFGYCGPGTVTTNVWRHFVGTYDGATVRLYVDGSLCTGATPVVTPLNNSGAPWVYINGPSGTAGLTVDEFRVYDRALSLGEVQALYNSSN